MNRTIVGLAVVALFASCGPDDEGNNDNGTANSSNSTANSSNSSNSTANANSGFEGWSVTFEGGEDVFDLPDVSGDDLGGSKVGDWYQLTGVGEEADLMLQVTVGDALEAKQYEEAKLVSVNYHTNDYSCSGGTTISVDVTAVEPARGTFSGTMSCTPTGVEIGPDDIFETNVTGEFGETMSL